jgi:adenosylmethionine-8-amino-7-oxononanoate aminotransferase
MRNLSTQTIQRLDRAHVWHPFTPFDSWLDESYEITSIVKGEGCVLTDINAKRYLDANSSIWVNLHGHRNARITNAIKAQLDRIAHSSFLGLTNDKAPVLAQKLLSFSNPHKITKPLSRVFFSDDGSTAIEAAVKIVFQYFRLTVQSSRSRFVCLQSGYHGDTVGAMSVGHSPLFHSAYKQLLFQSKPAMAPYCYRCPYNKAKPANQDARESRKCRMECIGEFRKAVESCGRRFAGAVVEPIIQGAAGMIMHPKGYLEAITNIVHENGGKLILDEVMTGFYRTGYPLAFQKESCEPDVVALAKGLTGGYLPLAATLVTDELVQPFMGGIEKTFYHGHSYSGNQLGCAAALANLDILESTAFRRSLEKKIAAMKEVSQVFWSHPNVGDVRQEGLVLAVEVVEDRPSRTPFEPHSRMGWKITERAKLHGILTRPIGNVLLLMPPLSATITQIQRMTCSLARALNDIIPLKK